MSALKSMKVKVSDVMDWENCESNNYFNFFIPIIKFIIPSYDCFPLFKKNQYIFFRISPHSENNEAGFQLP